MNKSFSFSPPLRNGTIVHVIAIAAFAAIGAWGLWHASRVHIGPEFIFYFAPTALAVFVIPLLAYRIYALQNAEYRMDRDSIQLQWGFRLEIIPMNSVEWIRPESNLEMTLPKPTLRFPGAVLGRKKLPSGKIIIFLATHSHDLILIKTPEKIYAVSPSEPNGFISAFQSLIEMGSLAPPNEQSILPTFLLARVWQTIPARALILSGFVLGFALFVWVTFAASSRAQISLGFLNTGEPRSPIPSIRLMLLPVLNGFTYVINLLSGIFIFRKEENQPYAYLLWGASGIVALLFLLSMVYILRGS